MLFSGIKSKYILHIVWTINGHYMELWCLVLRNVLCCVEKSNTFNMEITISYCNILHTINNSYPIVFLYAIGVVFNLSTLVYRATTSLLVILLNLRVTTVILLLMTMSDTLVINIILFPRSGHNRLLIYCLV